jgi:hypothetical protein
VVRDEIHLAQSDFREAYSGSIEVVNSPRLFDGTDTYLPNWQADGCPALTNLGNADQDENGVSP